MSDDFKSKLEAYKKDELTETELEDFEKELEKLEESQRFLEENNIEQTKDAYVGEKKWWRRKGSGIFKTAFSIIGMILIFTVVSTVFTTVYYSWGEPDRIDVYRNVIDHTFTITDPYGYLGGTSTNVHPFFRMEATRDIKKKVGDENIKAGEMTVNVLFSKMFYPVKEYAGKISDNKPSFSYPSTGGRNESAWNQLDQLPEGTVVSAYVSFAQLLETNEVFQRFAEKEMDLIWMAVDTGVEEDEKIIHEPIGFPNSPIWHDDDMIVTSREEKKGLFGRRVVSEGSVSPSYTEGDHEMLHRQFLKTLSFLETYERKASDLYFGNLNLSERMDYLDMNGFQHYGVVITGPTKDILQLKEEPWIRELAVDEVRFWNWRE
ncbi:hypothetical protein G4V62_18325 [Bacillaceae bacterium SIJ1]|uniref:anti-sigma factor n=1 Tax=Litoribacterium kuwaitense TaxID=1398745 RepID=UPI0013EC6B88|nr:anti-sigma factor [Litoribacterium kuwaitense]NGP46800.1 hypothetical protein [Litoribacterium kuwaitense]